MSLRKARSQQAYSFGGFITLPSIWPGFLGPYCRRDAGHNFALDMAWLPWAVLPKRRWPKIRFKEKRAVTLAEHQAIVANESNPERRAYYECCWHLGGAQTDIAKLTAEDVDWQNKIVSF